MGNTVVANGPNMPINRRQLITLGHDVAKLQHEVPMPCEISRHAVFTVAATANPTIWQQQPTVAAPRQRQAGPAPCLLPA